MTSKAYISFHFQQLLNVAGGHCTYLKPVTHMACLPKHVFGLSKPSNVFLTFVYVAVAAPRFGGAVNEAYPFHASFPLLTGSNRS